MKVSICEYTVVLFALGCGGTTQEKYDTGELTEKLELTVHLTAPSGWVGDFYADEDLSPYNTFESRSARGNTDWLACADVEDCSVTFVPSTGWDFGVWFDSGDLSSAILKEVSLTDTDEGPVVDVNTVSDMPVNQSSTAFTSGETIEITWSSGEFGLSPCGIYEGDVLGRVEVCTEFVVEANAFIGLTISFGGGFEAVIDDDTFYYADDRGNITQGTISDDLREIWLRFESADGESDLEDTLVIR